MLKRETPAADSTYKEHYSLLNSPMSRNAAQSDSLHDSANFSRGTDKLITPTLPQEQFNRETPLPIEPISKGFLPVVRPVDKGNVRNILMIKTENSRSPF